MKKWRRHQMFKKLKVFAVLVFLLFVAPIASAGDEQEIHLKDGRFIQVERCWEKNGEVIFTLKGGDGRLYSLNKELVSEIKGNEEDDPQEEQAAR
jgi:hypothetical protein